MTFTHIGKHQVNWISMLFLTCTVMRKKAVWSARAVRYINIDIEWKNAACLFPVFRFSFVVIVVIRKQRKEGTKPHARTHKDTKNLYEKRASEGMQQKNLTSWFLEGVVGGGVMISTDRRMLR